MPRAFVALDLPGPALDRLEAATRGLPFGRVTPRENLHLTLAFLDDQPLPVLETLHEGLAAIRQPAVAVEARALDLWGGRGPDLLVALFEPTEPLARLQSAAARAARDAGIALERRRFRPHATLARFPKDHGRAARLQDWLSGRGALAPFEAEANSFALYRSILKPDGAIHEELARYPLG